MRERESQGIVQMHRQALEIEAGSIRTNEGRNRDTLRVEAIRDI